MTPNKILPAWWAEADTLKTQVLGRLEKMSPDERCRSPHPGTWSAAQVVVHLILVEERLVKKWHVAAKNSPVVKPSRRAELIIRLASFGMKNSFRLPTLPILDPNQQEPTGSGDFRVLSERWETIRERLPDTFPSEDSLLWIVHPIFGPLSCQQFGTFLVAHLQYHLRRWPGKDSTRD